MANEKILNTRIQLLGDFESEWSKVNPILKKNEAAISWALKENETVGANTGYGAFIGIKYGDGVKTWSELEYSDKGAKDAINGLREDVNGLLEDLTITYVDDVAAEVPTAHTVDVVANLSAEGMTVTEELVTVATEAGVDAAIEEVNVFDIDMNTINALGGIAAGTNLDGLTTHEILKKLLYPYVAPSIGNATASPNGGTYEKGVTKTITSVSIAITKKSEPITKVALYNGSTLIEEKTGDTVKNGGTITFSGLSVVVPTNGNQLTVKVTYPDANGKPKTESKNTSAMSFVYPYYMGAVNAGTKITEDIIEDLTKKVEGKATKSHSYTINDQHIVFAYPKAHGVLKSIIDPNGYETIGGYNRSELSITGLDETAQTYYVYASKDPGTSSGFTVTFKY